MESPEPLSPEKEARVQEWIKKNVNRSKLSIVTIDNTPKVEPSKLVKLTSFLHKRIKDKTGLTPLGLELPVDEYDVTLGFAFTYFETEEDAVHVVRILNGFKMDKLHQFKVTNKNFFDWDKYKDSTVTDNVESPKLNMDSFCEENLYEYLCDEAAREQYLIRYAAPASKSALSKNKEPSHELEIYWNDYQVMNAGGIDVMKKVYASKSNLTTLFAKWSPLGTYLVTFSEEGLNLWGGNDFKSMGHFLHQEIAFIDWSPRETYLITWASELIVWDVQLGKKIRRVLFGFGPNVELPFKWSYDESFIAKSSDSDFLLYDLNNRMKLYQPDPNQTSTLHIEGMKGLEWSPTDNYFCYWVPEENNTPARVTLMEVVTHQKADGTTEHTFHTIAQKNLYRVQSIRMNWHPQGDFLACRVEKTKKSSSGNHIVSSYELFRIRHKDRAVETIELPDQVYAFDFEPRGHRFALIHGPSEVKLNVSFYTMGGVKSGEVKLLGTFSGKQVNHINWSPKGKYLLLAGMKQPFNGKFLEFWNVDELDLMETASHFMCTNVNWDASGRFVTTFVSHGITPMENGIKMWTFQGVPVLEKKLDKFFQFEWRPRPPSLLTEKDMKVLKTKTRPTWEKKYAEEEKNILEKDERERKERMIADLKAFKEMMADIKKVFSKQAETRHNLIKGTGACFDSKVIVTQEEELVDKNEVRVTDLS